MTINEKNNKLIKDWIRPLQKSLIIETENKFINTLGRKKYFSDYLHESLKSLENLNLSEDYLKIYLLKHSQNQVEKIISNYKKKLIYENRIKKFYTFLRKLFQKILDIIYS